MDVVELASGDTHPLRASILRTGTPSDEVVFTSVGDEYLSAATGTPHIDIVLALR